MSTTTNNAYVARSMNGIISIDDGAGGLMEGGVITANELVIDAIQSKLPPNVVSLFTNTTTTINVGSATSTLNVSNLNVSNINLPSITFTTLNVSNANSSTSNTSTSNASTSNSSTSNSSTSNSSIANNGTTNSQTTNTSSLNVSTFNISTTSGTTLNMSTANVSLLNTNNIQPEATGTVSLFTNIIGYNDIHIGNVSDSDIYLESPVIAVREIIGGDYISTTDLRTDIIQPGTTNAICDIYTNASVDQITVGRSGTNCYMNSSLLCEDGLETNSIKSLNLTGNNTLFTNITTGNITVGNLTATGNIFLRTTGGMYLGLTASEVKIAEDATNIEIGKTATGIIHIGNINASLNTSKIICSNIASAGGNITTLQASTLNSTNARLVNVKTKYIEPDPSEITNDVFLYTTTTTGLVNIGTGLTTGKILMGSPTSSVNMETLNVSTVNASNYNAVNINASYIATGELYSDYTELGNTTFTNDTVDTLVPTSTINLFPALTTGTLNIATNVTTSGAISIGNGTATGSFSVSEGTININPKSTLNIANQIVAGTANICNSNTYRGTLNIAATANVSNTSTNTVNLGSSTSTLNINSKTINLGATTSNISVNSQSITLNTTNSFIDFIKPLRPQYSIFANTGTTVNGTIGQIITGAITRANGYAIVDNVDTEYGNITNLPIGVYVVYSKIGVLSAGAVTPQTQGSYIRDTAGFVVSESKYMGTSQGSTPAGRIYWYENCATYACFAITTLRVYLALDWGGGSNTASTANNRITATRIG